MRILEKLAGLSLRRTVIGVALLHVALAAVISFKFDWHISGLIRINAPSAVLHPDLMSPGLVVLTQSTGFDGKEHYFLAVDPFPGPGYPMPYRLKRILYPLVSYLLAGGQRALLPLTLFLANWIAVVGGTYFLGKILAESGHPPVLAAIYGASIGEIVGIKYDLTTPLALALAVGGIYCWRRHRAIASLALFSLSLLANEYTLAIPLLLAAHTFLFSKERVRGLLLALSPVPWITWVLFITHRYGRHAVTDAGRVFCPPFQGIADILRHFDWHLPWRHFVYSEIGPFLVAVVVVVVTLCEMAKLRSGIRPYALLVLYYVGVSIFLKEDCWRVINISRYLSAVFPLVVLSLIDCPSRLDRLSVAFSAALSFAAILGVLVEPRVPFILWP